VGDSLDDFVSYQLGAVKVAKIINFHDANIQTATVEIEADSWQNRKELKMNHADSEEKLYEINHADFEAKLHTLLYEDSALYSKWKEKMEAKKAAIEATKADPDKRASGGFEIW
jgi:hypothetical protein